MRKRTKARECALKILYQVDITGDSCKDSLEMFWQTSGTQEGAVKEFATRLVEGTFAHLKEIDKEIAKSAANWQMKRMAVVDRNILRIATFEILYLDDIPPKVSINEAVDLAKKFGDNDSGRFVNGIIDKIKSTSCEKKDDKK
ncbi:transcription antitermination factor NusB [Candidatus Omnitrophota bacterium]